MEVEQQFAAAVLNARGNARLANTGGFIQTVADQVFAALADLWEAAQTMGLDASDIHAIADRWIEYDDDGDAWPRVLATNVVPLRR